MVETSVTQREKLVIEIAINIISPLISKNAQMERAQDEAPLHLEVAGLVYLLAMHDCAMAKEAPEALEDHLQHLAGKVREYIQEGILHNQTTEKAVH
jgi:hypothetical protein